MKRNTTLRFFGRLAAAALLLAASCQRDPLNESAQAGGEFETVCFSVVPESVPALTRGEVNYPAAGQYDHIGDGTKADMLIYAVYEESGDSDILLEEYAEANPSLPVGIIPGKGQSIRMVGSSYADKEFPVSISLQLKRDKTYKIAFWAQSSLCKAYDTDDLTKVKIRYEELEGSDSESTPNNDELRDAFCWSERVEVVNRAGENRTVYLYRPLAQINVGTTGYDYETVVKDPHSRYIYTRSQIITANRYLNVVKDEILKGNDTELYSALDYTYARIPAYIHYTEDNEAFQAVDITKVTDAQKEEFLKVKLYPEDAAGEDYMTDADQDGFLDYAGLENGDGKKTETFKYLSMGYVLVASTKTEAGTIDNVNVWIATDAAGKDEVKIVELTNVPAQRNWRTNIVGNILTEAIDFHVVLDPIYNGDYNGSFENGDVDWSGPLADGAYYDAEADEILISNVNGLIWLQKMVNGKLVYRETHTLHKNYSSQIGSVYEDTYYDEAGLERTFADDFGDHYIPKPTDVTLLRRILKATHQDHNPNSPSGDGWPKNSNFHFMGMKGSKADPAKVKLVADIDLSGIDWLPIGFDCDIYDGSMRTHFDANKNLMFIMGKETTGAGDRRAFCGIFDGNGHTISNVRNVRFSAAVLDVACQNDGNGPYDTPQWFPAGLFGQLSGDAAIRNLRVANLDLYGYHTGGGIAGTVTGDKVVIEDCIIDGGQVVLSPMYRGDVYNMTATKPKGRTFARGLYVGGIVGFYNAEGSITGCQVQNMELRAYRNIGGLVGTVGSTIDSNIYSKGTSAVIEDNLINNMIIIADKFTPYDFCFSITPSGSSVYKNAFGWNQNQSTLSSDFVGGSAEEKYPKNTQYDLIRSVFSTISTTNSDTRDASITNVPLNYLPLLSSWFCDNVTLKAHFTGKPSAYKQYREHAFAIGTVADKSETSGTFNFPFKLPTDLTVDFVKSSGQVGMYVESITLEGQDDDHRYSVLTVEDVTEPEDCAMFITSRDISQFSSGRTQATAVNDMIVRGIPYAYTGICLSPNKNTKSITLSDVSVYDVYRTLALDDSPATDKVWPGTPDPSNVTLTVKNSNLRGYTVPGAGWKQVSYSKVVFEHGATVTISGAEEENLYACDVDAPTTFTDCTFKAPFVIRIAPGTSVTFAGDCTASTGNTKEPIAYDGKATKITVSVDGTVTYE